MRTRLRVVVLLAALSLAACSEDGTDPVETPHPVFGAWMHLYTCGGLSGTCIPDDDPTSALLMLKYPDSAYVDVAGDTLLRLRIRVVEAAATAPEGRDFIEAWVSAQSDWIHWQTIRRLSADTLVLSDEIADGYASTFERASD